MMDVLRAYTTEGFVMGIGLVIVAAGNGSRMGGTVRKPYLELGGTPILIKTIQQFIHVPDIIESVLVVHSEEIERTSQLLQKYSIRNITVVVGGKERQDSVIAGVHALSSTIDTVLIHDGARPFVSKKLIDTIIQEVQQRKAVIPAIPVKDTIKIVQDNGVIERTPDRKGLWAAQTPQAFSRSYLLRAFAEADTKGITATDDASILEALGYEVYVTTGESTNIKITTQEDLVFGEAIVQWMEEKR